MNPVIHASHIKPGLRIATIPSPNSGRIEWTEFAVTGVETVEVDDNTYYRLTDARGNSIMDTTGDYHLVSPVDDTMVLVLLDGACTNGHEYKRTVALPVPDEDSLGEWWNSTVWDATGDGQFDGSDSYVEVTVTTGPEWLVGQTETFGG